MAVEQGSPTFPVALRAAIAARGLGLERLRDRLRQRGVRVSVATLSYWQSGRSRPERRESMVALRHLEEVLEVPEGALAGLLGPTKPRGRWRYTAGGLPAIGALWPDPAPVEDALGRVDTRWDERLTRLSQHDRVHVGPGGAAGSFLSRQVLRAEADGPDRWVVIMHTDEPGHPPPLVRPLRGCALGRVAEDRDGGLVVAELLFDRPLARGETVITEHELVHVPPGPVDDHYERKFRLPVREFVLEVCFDPAALPAFCEQYTRDDRGVEDSRPITPDSAGSVHGVALNFGPGCFGIRWGGPS
ncbi:helix-turn-helix domain-containing protein [Actinokineospora sp. NPDC004072]